jgi:hypothetical protein
MVINRIANPIATATSKSWGRYGSERQSKSLHRLSLLIFPLVPAVAYQYLQRPA